MLVYIYNFNKSELNILVYTRSDETNYCPENVTNRVSVIMNNALAS